MKHFASSRFWRCLEALPADIQALAHRNFALLKDNPEHPSLHFKLIANHQLYSVRMGLHVRALGVAVPDGVQ